MAIRRMVRMAFCVFDDVVPAIANPFVERAENSGQDHWTNANDQRTVTISILGMPRMQANPGTFCEPGRVQARGMGIHAPSLDDRSLRDSLQRQGMTEAKVVA